RSARAGGMTSLARSRGAWLFGALVPALGIVTATGAIALFGHRSPTRLAIELAWAGPTAARPLGSGEAGIDVLAVVSHATLRAVALAMAVAAFGFSVGTPLGIAAALRGGATARWTLRAADLVQSFPTFLLALAVLSAVRVPLRWHMGLVFS